METGLVSPSKRNNENKGNIGVVKGRGIGVVS